MQHYPVIISPQADADLECLYNYIRDVILSESLAIKYTAGIYNTIYKLRYIGYSIAVNYNTYLQHFYGEGVRTINYKKMTVIYIMRNDTVYVRRVIASRLIR